MVTKYKHMVGSGSSLSWVYCNNQLMKEKNMETYININKFTIFFLKLSLYKFTEYFSDFSGKDSFSLSVVLIDNQSPPKKRIYVWKHFPNNYF